MYTRHMQDHFAPPDLHPAPPAPPPASAPARQRVLDYIREAILSGRLPGGTFLEEERVSAAVGVSRTPVREAFQQLHGERLIELLPRRGAMVRVVTAQELVEIYEARLVLERHAAATLCRLGLPAPAAMREAVAALASCPPTNASRHVRLNAAFHRALIAAAGNAVLEELYASLSARQDLVAMVSVSIDPDRLHLIHQEHAALLAALDAHDSPRAQAILAAHLSPVGEILARLPAGPSAAAAAQAK